MPRTSAAPSSVKPAKQRSLTNRTFTGARSRRRVGTHQTTATDPFRDAVPIGCLPGGITPATTDSGEGRQGEDGTELTTAPDLSSPVPQAVIHAIHKSLQA